MVAGDLATSGQQQDAPAGGAETANVRERREYAGTGVVTGFVVGLILASAAVIFVAQNGERVGVEWLWTDFRVSLAVIILGAILLGIIADEAIGIVWRRMRRRRLAERAELASLRRRVDRGHGAAGPAS